MSCFPNCSLIVETLWIGTVSGLLVFMLRKLIVFQMAVVLMISKWIDVIDKKSTFKIPGLSLLLKLKRVSFIVSIAKTASKKIVVLIHYMKQITTIFRKRIFNSFISFRKVRPKEKNRRKLRWTNIQFKMMHYTIFRLCVFIISHTRLEWIYNVTHCSKLGRYVKFKWVQQELNQQLLCTN